MGSGLSAAAYASNGWLGVSVLGGVLPAIGLAFWLVDTALRRRARAQAQAVSVAAPATRA